MANDNTIANRYIAHALAVIRTANAMGRDVDAILVKLAGDLRYLLTRSDIGELGKRDLNALLSDINDAIYQRYNDVLDHQNESLPELIDIESTFAQKAGDYNNKPSDTALAGVMSGLLILGSSLKDWWRKQATDLVYKVSASVKNAARLPESTRAAVTKVLGQTRGIGQAGDLGIARRNAASIVQTTVQAAASDARLAALKANGVKYFEWHAILDAKVCPECAMRAGKLYTVDGEPVGHKIPYVPIPVHFHDRCIALPHSGDPPADGGPHALQFNDWLKSLTDEQENDFLGKGRAELYRRGVITLNDLINQGGQLLTLAELRAGL